MEISKDKIEELKKLIGFGFLIIDSKKNNKHVQKLMETQSYNDLVPLLARLAVGYDLEHDENKLSGMFNEPQTTKMLENAHSEYMEFKKEEQK